MRIVAPCPVYQPCPGCSRGNDGVFTLCSPVVQGEERYGGCHVRTLHDASVVFEGDARRGIPLGHEAINRGDKPVYLFVNSIDTFVFVDISMMFIFLCSKYFF